MTGAASKRTTHTMLVDSPYRQQQEDWRDWFAGKSDQSVQGSGQHDRGVMIAGSLCRRCPVWRRLQAYTERVHVAGLSRHKARLKQEVLRENELNYCGLLILWDD